MLRNQTDDAMIYNNETNMTGTVVEGENENGVSMTQRPNAVDKSHEINKGYTFIYMVTIGIGMFQFGKLDIYFAM